MNLFELQERLKDFSQEQLVREMQAPTGTAPQFLVLSELQRRQRMMAEEQAQMQTPQTTVAEDAIAAAGVPQGGLADMARSMAPQTDMDMNTAVQPVERMRDGGSVDDRDSGFIRPRSSACVGGVVRMRWWLTRFYPNLGLTRQQSLLLSQRRLHANDPRAGNVCYCGSNFKHDPSRKGRNWRPDWIGWPKRYENS
jgi:hypothetical protein